MEKALFHAKFMTMALYTCTDLDPYHEYIVSVHLINHQIKWCMGVVEKSLKDGVAILVHKPIKGGIS